MDLERIQAYLGEHGLDGWLMADFHGRNDIAMRMLGITGMVTRRSFYFIPAQGEPVGLFTTSNQRNSPGSPDGLYATPATDSSSRNFTPC